MMTFLPDPVQMILGAHRLMDFSDHGPLMFAVRQKLTGYPAPPPASCLSGRTVLVTGATAGVGLKAAEEVLRLGARLILAARNMEKAEKTRQDFLAKVPGAQVLLYELDMDSLGSVDGFVEKLRADGIGRIDVALLNAGVILKDRRRVDGGWSQMMQINFRSTAYLALHLISFLTHEAPDTPADTAAGGPGRLVLVTSEAHAFSGYAPPPADGDAATKTCRSIAGSSPTATVPAFCNPSLHVNAPRLATAAPQGGSDPLPTGTVQVGTAADKIACCAECARLFNCVAWRFVPVYVGDPTDRLPGGFDPWGRGSCDIVYHVGAAAPDPEDGGETPDLCPNGLVGDLLEGSTNPSPSQPLSPPPEEGGGNATHARSWMNVYYNGWNQGSCGAPVNAFEDGADDGMGDEDTLCPS